MGETLMDVYFRDSVVIISLVNKIFTMIEEYHQYDQQFSDESGSSRHER